MISDINIRINRDLCYTCGNCVERCSLDNLRLSLSPCRTACPLHMNCQGYVRLTAQGKDEEAAREMRTYLPFGSILGRVCEAPCEKACQRGRIDGSVHIRALKRYLADSYPEITRSVPNILPDTRHEVAVIGSGPAGLMVAYELRTKGHTITVFESEDRPGGLLRSGFPPSILPPAEVDGTTMLLEEMGVTFKTGQSVGSAIKLGKVEDEFEVVVLAFGQNGKKDDLPPDLFDPDSGRLTNDPVTNQSSFQDTIFVCGSAATGVTSVVEAMASGRETAISVDRFLRGEGLRWGRDYWQGPYIKDYTVDPTRAKGGPRRDLGRDVEKPLSAQDARIEAERCLSCGRPVEYNLSCWFCLCCEIECPANALEVRLPYLVR